MLPQAFLDRMKLQLGAAYPEFLASLERPRAVALRMNPQKGDAPALEFLRGGVPWEPLGYYYAPDARPGLHVYHDAGVYYLQEASAMAPVALLDPRPGERVCDLCAAPGGKSTQIAARMHGEGVLVCNEIHPKRARILSRNVERMGVANAVVTNAEPTGLARRMAGFFDRVLVDAPCSGEGMFRKEAAAVTDWSEETVAMCARRQAQILDAAAALVRPGGRLVYSTCTFSEEENEETVARFLATHPNFSAQDVIAPWFARTGVGQFRLWPHLLLGEGQFAAVLRRGEDVPPAPVPPEPGMKLPEPFAAFTREKGIALPQGSAVLFGKSLFWMPPQTPVLAGCKVLRPGLELGQLCPGRVEPAHALAMWLRPDGEAENLPPEDGRIAAYLRGDVIPSARRGWQLVAAGGYSLGWGKGDGSVLKNHYPKGLRR